MDYEKETETKCNTLVRSKEMDEIIGRPPHWLIRWGVSVFFSIILLFFAISYFIYIPETVSLPCKLAPESTFIPVQVPGNGMLTKMMIKEGAMVKKGDTLLYWKETENENSSVVTASVSGQAVFTSPLPTNPLTTTGKPLFYIIPTGLNYYAFLYAQIPAYEKLKTGNDVNISLTNYPANHNGYICGKITYISNIQTATGYYVKIKLLQGLKTDKGKQIPFDMQLNAEASVVVNKQKLINKFIHIK